MAAKRSSSALARELTQRVNSSYAFASKPRRAAPARHRRPRDRRLEDLGRVMQRRLLADDDLADDEALRQRLVPQVLQQVALAGAEVAADEQAAGGAAGAHRLQPLLEAPLDLVLRRAQRQHGVAVGHAGAQRLDGAPLRHACAAAGFVAPGAVAHSVVRLAARLAVRVVAGGVVGHAAWLQGSAAGERRISAESGLARRWSCTSSQMRSLSAW